MKDLVEFVRVDDAGVMWALVSVDGDSVTKTRRQNDCTDPYPYFDMILDMIQRETIQYNEVSTYTHRAASRGSNRRKITPVKQQNIDTSALQR